MKNNLVQPPVIRYNLKDRGRQFRGVERNFDIPAIVAAINSPACQERVKTRGMLGYLGHWVRIRFGLEPPEGGIAEGKAHAIEPAIVTTHLKAYPNGDIEHQTEFLDNDTGRIASRMFANKVGGFSSVIDEVKVNFFGFDWVNDPNYSTNRGYGLALDSIATGGMTLDDILAAELQDRTQAMALLLDKSEYREQLALDSAVALRNENEQLLSLLAEYDEKAKVQSTTVPNNETMARMLRDKAAFDSAVVLPQVVVEKTKEDKKRDQEYNNIRSRVVGY